MISAGAFMFAATQATYSAAKAALFSFTRSMAAAWAPIGVRVNALAPGTTLTDMVTNNPDAVVESMRTISHLGRFADPDEMVGPALFLASDAASYVTGQVAAGRRRTRGALSAVMPATDARPIDLGTAQRGPPPDRVALNVDRRPCARVATTSRRSASAVHGPEAVRSSGRNRCGWPTSRP